MIIEVLFLSLVWLLVKERGRVEKRVEYDQGVLFSLTRWAARRRERRRVESGQCCSPVGG